jgi:hypothetical protein
MVNTIYAHGVTIYRYLNADETLDQGRGCDVQIYEIRRDEEDVSVERIYTLHWLWMQYHARERA